MADLLGPATAEFATTTRPADARVFGVTPTWFAPCSSPDAEDGTEVEADWLNGMIGQLHHLIVYSGIAIPGDRDEMTRRAIEALIAAAIAGIGIQYAPVFPHVETADGRLSLTGSTGQVVLNEPQTWLWRGHRRFSATSFNLADRTFATLANKTYHLRWYVPGHSVAPAGTYPNGRLWLRDLTDSGYNPSALAEADATFDSKYDDMLIARVVTNGSNVPTITALANFTALAATASRATSASTYGTRAAVPKVSTTPNWSRTPKVFLAEYDADVDANTNTVTAMLVTTQTRYSVVYDAVGYNDGSTYIAGKAVIRLEA